VTRQVVLDTETTGLNPQQGHRIIEIGCIEIIDRLVTESTYHCYINPDREIDTGAQKVHGISAEFLADKPKFSHIAQDFLDFIADAELIIHNAPFDLGFLNCELSLWDQSCRDISLERHVVDTLLLARKKHPGQRNNLDALCQRYSIDNSNRELHGALLDAQLLARVYLAMTGGQGSLFTDIEVDKSNKQDNQNKKNTLSMNQEIPLKVIYANEAELSTHQDYLMALKETGGEPSLWDKRKEVTND